MSCDEGFTGNNVTYLYNVTSDPTMVDWVIINGTEMNHMCQRGVLPHYHCTSTFSTFLSSEIM